MLILSIFLESIKCKGYSSCSITYGCISIIKVITQGSYSKYFKLSISSKTINGHFYLLTSMISYKHLTTLSHTFYSPITNMYPFKIQMHYCSNLLSHSIQLILFSHYWSMLSVVDYFIISLIINTKYVIFCSLFLS